MKKFNKLLNCLIIIIPIFFLTLLCNYLRVSSPCLNCAETTPVKVAVIVYDINGLYVSEVIKSLKTIQSENPNSVEFTFFSSNMSQDTQNSLIDKILQNKDYKLLVVELIDLKHPEMVINRAKEKNFPVILFSREPTNMHPIQSYNKAIYIGTVLEQAGILEGKILGNEWNNNKMIIDKNKDNILQYILLKGPSDNPKAIARSKYVIQTLNNLGIKTHEVKSQNSDWNNRKEAEQLTQSLFSLYGNKIEAIIATNDTMALGALDAIQKLGYNLGNKEKTIPIVGVDAVQEVREQIKKGYITGSVFQDTQEMAEVIYVTGMNLIQKKPPLEGTNYKFDQSGVAIRLPYQIYVPK